jgi:hypothetical protein
MRLAWTIAACPVKLTLVFCLVTPAVLRRRGACKVWLNLLLDKLAGYLQDAGAGRLMRWSVDSPLRGYGAQQRLFAVRSIIMHVL